MSEVAILANALSEDTRLTEMLSEAKIFSEVATAADTLSKNTRLTTKNVWIITAEQYQDIYRTATKVLEKLTLFGSRVKNLFLYYLDSRKVTRQS